MNNRIWKLINQHPNNDDADLLGFYETKCEAEADIKNVLERNAGWVKKENVFVERVSIEMMFRPVATDYSHYIRSLIPDEEWKRVMKSYASAEIDCNCCCCGYGGRTYYNLSKMIPKDWTVIDFGCAYNTQSYLFKNHKRFIGVEPEWNNKDFHFEYFKAPNTELLFMTGQDFIENELPKMDLDLSKTFAICNYVPSGACNLMVRETFKNLWVFYP